MGTPTVRTDARRSVPAAERLTRRFDPTEVDMSSHALERDVRRALTSEPGLTFSSLVVHRVRDGVCLTGVIESMSEDTDVCSLARQAGGINEVINRLRVRSAASG